jgi:PAS domain S-box-containing protein
VRTLAYWGGDEFLDNVEFELAGTPCRDVIDGTFTHHTEGVGALFPQDKMLAARGVESYLGVPLLGADGSVAGHLALLDTKPLVLDAELITTLQVIASRACMELERLRAETRLRDSEERLATVVGSAMDAIVTIDDERRITLFNAAAEGMFRCSADATLGQTFDQFLSSRFRAFFEGYLQEMQPDRTRKKPLWAPGGLTAVRADGDEFPIEATISPVELAGQTLFSLILRDVNDRKEAEQALARLQLEKSYLQEELHARDQLQEIVGDSGAMQEVFNYVTQVAPTDSTVLITGETGTGKELVARAIHNMSARKDRLLVNLNCAALPRELVESELFGHEKGAFTGALQQKKGRFELADGGSLFLDEIGELSLEAQAKLLRVLQEHQIERVGGTESIQVDVRVIAATNRDLAHMVSEGAFRSDLYYRLNVFPIQVPPLRERSTDIPKLAEFFLASYARALSKPLRGISDESMARLKSYAWPGNVRELQNVLERAAILARDEVLEVDPSLGSHPSPGPDFAGRTLKEVERAHIVSVLESTDGVIEGAGGAATILNLHANTLRSRMRKLGIEKPTRGRNR